MAQAIGEPICLHEDTLVRMADWTTKKIKDIKTWICQALIWLVLAHARLMFSMNLDHVMGIEHAFVRTMALAQKLLNYFSTKEHKVQLSK